MNIGDISDEIDAIDRAHDRFTTAVEGPCMEDYASDEEAYERLGNATCQLRDATLTLLSRIQVQRKESVSLVAGVYMDRSIADFQRSCDVHIHEEQRRPNPDSALIALLCDAVRCSRELTLQSKGGIK